MKFTIERSQFNNVLTEALKAISPQSVIPVLQDVKLDLQKTTLSVTTSNSDITIVQQIDTSNEDHPITDIEAGSYVVPARFLASIVKKLSGDKVTATVEEGKSTMLVKSGRAKFKIPCLPGNTYPHLPEYEEKHSLTLPAPDLLQVLKQSTFAAGDNESRPILAGVDFTFDKDQFLAIATDAHRLSRSLVNTQAVDDEIKDDQQIIPAANLKIVAGIVNKLDDLENASITIDRAVDMPNVRFHVGNTVIYSRLLEGQFPDVTNLLKGDYQTFIKIDRKEMLAAIERAGLAAMLSKNKVVQLAITTGDEPKAVLTSSAQNTDADTEEELDTDAITGEDLTISFNPDYIKDALQAFPSDDVYFSFASPLRPFTITNPDDDSDQFIHLVTPIRTY